MGVTIRTDDSVKGNTPKNADARYAPYIDTKTGTWWQYDKTERDFVDTGISPYGTQGPKGDTGDTGTTGPQGIPGVSVTVTDVSESSVDGGSNVVTMSDGTQFVVKNGHTGATGPAGKDGKDGLAGKDGSIGPQGIPGEKGEPGTGVTVLDVSETHTDGGANIVTFSDGTKVSVRNGNRGSQGPRGYQGVPGVPGQTGETGNGIASIVLNDDYSLTINYTNGNSYTTDPIRGEKGDPGEVQWETVATEWRAWTEYYGGHLYVYNDELYLCTLDEDESGESSYFPSDDMTKVTIDDLYRRFVSLKLAFDETVQIATPAETRAYLASL